MLVNDPRRYHSERQASMNAEVTLSTMVSANPGITNSGLMYGEIICDEIVRRYGSANLGSVLEIGGGLGNLAKEFVGRLWQRYSRAAAYAFLEYSPEFFECQKEAMQDYKFRAHILGDAHYLSGHVAPNSANIVICNEMIGDLVTIDRVPHAWIINPEQAIKNEWLNETIRLLGAAGIEIEQSAKRLAFNTGAMKLVEQLYGILKPGGIAFISENSCEIGRTEDSRHRGNLSSDEIGGPYLDGGSRERLERLSFPRRLELYDHVEYDVKFSHLERIAHFIGFEAERGSLLELAGIKDEAVNLAIGLGEIFRNHHLSDEEVNYRCSQISDAHLFQLVFRMMTDPEMLRQLLRMTKREFNARWAHQYLQMKTYSNGVEYLFLRKPR